MYLGVDCHQICQHSGLELQLRTIKSCSNGYHGYVELDLKYWTENLRYKLGAQSFKDEGIYRMKIKFC